MEGSIESWNDRFRISNICVFDPARRHGGLGTALMNRITEAAESTGARMIVLETQSCNESAIAFSVGPGSKIEGSRLFQIGSVSEYPGAALQQRGGVVRIPDGPCVDIALLEGGARIGGGKVNRLNIAKFQTCELQGAQQQIVGAGAFLKSDLFPF